MDAASLDATLASRRDGRRPSKKRPENADLEQAMGARTGIELKPRKRGPTLRAKI